MTHQADNIVDDVSAVQLATALGVESHSDLHVWQTPLVWIVLNVLRQLLQHHSTHVVSTNQKLAIANH